MIARNILFILIVAWLCGRASTADQQIQMRDVIGATHTGGRYCLTEKDFLNEGADQLLEMGSRVIKVWFTATPQKNYPFHSTWPKIGNLVDLARSPYFRDLFQKPFTTYILEAYSVGKPDHYYINGMTDEDKKWESDRFYEITRYLLNRYKGTGKTFVLQNWESDWALTDPKTMLEPNDTAIKGMIDWLNARQDGVDRARAECGIHDVSVVHAAEVNLVKRAMEGKRCALNSVVPYTHCDLYSYSSWDTASSWESLYSSDTFTAALNYIKKKAPDSKLYGNDNVYLGEFGAPENKIGGEDKQLESVKRATEIALSAGMRYIVYWELYCNEPMKEYRGRPTNLDMSGFWLIRPDGSKTKVWSYFAGLLKQGKSD